MYEYPTDSTITSSSQVFSQANGSHCQIPSDIFIKQEYIDYSFCDEFLPYCEPSSFGERLSSVNSKMGSNFKLENGDITTITIPEDELNSVNAQLDAILEAERVCCPAPLLVPKKEPVSVECGVTNDTKPETAALVPLIPKEEPNLQIPGVPVQDLFYLWQLMVNVFGIHILKDNMAFNYLYYEGVAHTGPNEVCTLLFVQDISENRSGIQNRGSSGNLAAGLFPTSLHLPGPQADGRHRCVSCEASFETAAALEVHAKSHAGDLRCGVCARPFLRADKLRAHARVHTGERPYRCGVCGKCYKQFDYLKIHARVHTGERPYACDSCPKTFARADKLKVHRRVHTGECPYRCQACGRAFKRLDNLKSHSRVHTGERPFGCRTCGKAFASYEKLKVHSRTHTGERPYACEVCQKTFVSSGNLHEHRRVHTGRKRYSCGVCGDSFGTAGRLRVHSRSHVYLATAVVEAVQALV
ncbi:zinc finger protein 235-like [Schistocerca serialis cubense]|uniref:zinc finger protein 235-like n=1 Tax=Schistocerca serialis cubense TaxID=2023355 RepID=UPI00214F04B0|nr:zinc finger protein 235-like [Schistocerca serialis cubense]